jgi:hypothetical protein
MMPAITETPRDVRRQTIVAWVVVALLVAIMIARVVIAIWTIGDRGRTWQYRVAPLVPAETYSSTQPASASTKAPRQVELPKPTVGKRAK